MENEIFEIPAGEALEMIKEVEKIKEQEKAERKALIEAEWERARAMELSRMIDLAAKIGRIQREAEEKPITEEDIIYLDRDDDQADDDEGLRFEEDNE
jgi:hypothetical protein